MAATCPGWLWLQWSPPYTCDEAFAILVHCYASCTPLEDVVSAKTEETGKDMRPRHLCHGSGVSLENISKWCTHAGTRECVCVCTRTHARTCTKACMWKSAQLSEAGSALQPWVPRIKLRLSGLQSECFYPQTIMFSTAFLSKLSKPKFTGNSYLLKSHNLGI